MSAIEYMRRLLRGEDPVKPVETPKSPVQQHARPEPLDPQAHRYMKVAEEMRLQAIRAGDQGYGAVVVKAGVILGYGPSRVVTNEDPSGHAEMEAIRDAANRLGSADLAGCVMYSTSPPCAMCEAGAHWAGIGKLVSTASLRDLGKPRLRRC